MEPFKDTMIGTLQAENVIKSIITNAIQELPETAQDERMKPVGIKYITKRKESFKY